MLLTLNRQLLPMVFVATTGSGPTSSEMRALEECLWDITGGVQDYHAAETKEERVSHLLDQWKRKTMFMSSLQQVFLNESYQKLIGMGMDAVPALLSRLVTQGPDFLYWALQSITGEDPVPEKHQGHLDLISEDWIKWGRARGYV